MKGDITLKILESAKEGILDTSDFLLAFIMSGYGASSDMINKKAYEISSKKKRRPSLEDVKSTFSKNDWRKVNNRFNAMISKLDKDELIERSRNSKNSFVKITNSGLKKLEKLKAKKEFNPKKYKTTKMERPVLFMFDIPEKNRKSREWIRNVLIELEFKMIQKSVWMGKVKIPEEFSDSLRKLGIIQFIEIIEITKTGSIKNIKL